MSRILIIGATSGIGQALAELYAGSAACDRVYITGRRQAQLDSISAANAKIEGILFDPNEVSEIPAFAKKMSDKGLDLVVLNAGMQRGLDFSNPESVDVDILEAEMKLNFFAPVRFIKALIELYNGTLHTPLRIAVVTSGLALAPMPRCPGYCSSKAAMHSFLLSVRRQLVESGPENFVKLVEIFPPAVQTELHDPKHQIEFTGRPAFGVPLDEYSQDLFDRLVKEDEDEIAYGTSKQGLEKIGKAQRFVCGMMPLGTP